jgi:DNA primase
MSKEGELLVSIVSKDYDLKGSGRWLHGAEHDSLVVDFEKGVWFWNSKGISGTVYTWLTKVKDMSHEQAKEMLKQNKDFADTFIHTIKNSEETIVYPKLVDAFYENGQNNDREYWYKRGFSDQTIQRFKLGYNDGWYTIPIYQDGLFRDFQMRRDQPSKMIKHYYKGVGRLLFNSEILKYVDTVFITEGPTDCIALLQAGIPAVSHNAGSEGWLDDWFKYFMFQKRIYIVYDNDIAGKTGAIRVAKNLGEYRAKIYCFEGYDEKYDVGDFLVEKNSPESFVDLVEHRSYYCFESPLDKTKKRS